MKSDNANGLFGFQQPCQPSRARENVTVSCTVARHRGDDGQVTLTWAVVQIYTLSGVTVPASQDFLPFFGEIVFVPGDRLTVSGQRYSKT
jgi:hypothetical protein